MTDAQKQPLSVDIARRMHRFAQGHPAETPGDIRALYEGMADESRRAIADRLADYMDGMKNACLAARHRGSVQPDSDGNGGQPCSPCRQQIRYTRGAWKVVCPDLDR